MLNSIRNFSKTWFAKILLVIIIIPFVFWGMGGVFSGGNTNNPGPKVKCLSCFDIIQSMYRHDFKWCSCKGIAVDGGGDYLKMSYQPGAKYEVLDGES